MSSKNYSLKKSTLAVLSAIAAFSAPSIVYGTTQSVSLKSQQLKAPTNAMFINRSAKLSSKVVPKSTLKKVSKTSRKGQPMLAGKQLLSSLKSNKKNSKNNAPVLSAKQHKNLAKLKVVSAHNGIVSTLFSHSSGTPVFIKTKTPQTVKTKFSKSKTSNKQSKTSSQSRKSKQVSSANEFLKDNSDLLKINDTDNEFTLINQTTDKLETTHLKYQQTINGIPVWGKEVLVHLDSNDDVYLFQGRYNASVDGFDTDPTITSEKAIELATKDLNSTVSTIPNKKSDLVVYTKKDGSSVLTFQVSISPTLDQNWVYFINAKTGGIEHKFNNIQTDVVAASGIDLNGVSRNFNAWYDPSTSLYYLIDPSTPTVEHNPDPLKDGFQYYGETILIDLRNETEGSGYYSTNATKSNWSDPQAVSAAANTKETYDYFKNTHNRNGIDGNAGNLIIRIHYGVDYENAFFNGTSMTYGDGGSNLSSLAGCLDIVAHELTHGVVESTAGLIYQNQSGALNESFADVFGSMIDNDDWLMGEDCTQYEPFYSRSLSNPNSVGDPAHMSQYVNKSINDDHGGVHTNSGIPNRAAYLISDGLTEEALGQSIGREHTEQIYYRALTYLTRSSTFIDARKALIQSAQDLYGDNSIDVTAIKLAFDTVGIIDVGNFDSKPSSTDPINGDDMMAYLYPDDGVNNQDNEDYRLYVQTFSKPYIGYDAATDIGPYNKASDGDVPASHTRPAVYTTSTGSHFLYIGNDNNIYSAELDAPDEQLTEGWLFSSLAVSPNGKYITFVTNDLDDNNLYVLDVENDEVIPYPIVPETYQSESIESNSVLYADALSFDYTSNNIVFDALNCLSTPVSSCDDGYGYRFWSIGIFDIEAQGFIFPIPSQNPDYDIGYPTFAANNNFVIALDVIDNTDYASSGIRRSYTYTWDLETGESNVVHEYPSDSNYYWGVPSFWGEDNFLSIVSPVTGLSGTSTFRQALDVNWSPIGGLQSLNNYAADMPVMYRNAPRNLTGDVNTNELFLDFGSVNYGEEKELEFIVSNNGNSDVTINGITLDEELFSHNLINGLLPRGAQKTVKVNFTANGSGLYSDNIVINHDGGNGSTEISLMANSVDNVAPIVTPPSDLTLTPTSSTGFASNYSSVVTFLDGATATDNIEVIGLISHDAPANFSPNTTTTVTFSATDLAGNRGTASAKIIVNAYNAPAEPTNNTNTSGGGGGSSVFMLPLLLLVGLRRLFITDKINK